MSLTRTFFLDADNARERMTAIWRIVLEYGLAGKPVRIRVDEKQATRTLEQNAFLHAICNDCARQLEWADKKIDTEGWKRLFVDAWARAEQRPQGDIVPSLDGESVVNLGIQTRNMKVMDMAELIEFAQSWAIEHDVRLGA